MTRRIEGRGKGEEEQNRKMNGEDDGEKGRMIRVREEFFIL